MFKNLKDFLASRSRRKAAEKMPRDEKGRFLNTPAPEPVVAPSATKTPAKKAPAKKTPAKKKTATPAPKKK
jgi:DNA end-binding protein Ku